MIKKGCQLIGKSYWFGSERGGRKYLYTERVTDMARAIFTASKGRKGNQPMVKIEYHEVDLSMMILK